MTYSFFRTRLRKWLLLRRSPLASKVQIEEGFTLIELLVTLFIAGAIVSGLMYLAVELLTTDTRESTRTETQRDLQLSLDYMSSELREAIYIYPDVSDENFFPQDMTYGEPVLAFWRQQKLPEDVRNTTCLQDPLPADLETPCSRGQTYSLIVYSLGLPDSDANDTWPGRAQIIRYSMMEFDPQTGDRNTDFVSPIDEDNGEIDFAGWTSNGTGFSEPLVLTDFVDDGSGLAAAGANANLNQTRSGICPDTGTYSLSPETAIINPDGEAVRSFFACVSNQPTQNQEVIVYLQGNADGRSGIYEDDGFLPVLETRILSRGILDKDISSN